AADGKDVRLGGGATVIQQFLTAGLVDYMHIVVVPIVLGRGVNLWTGLEAVEKDFHVEAISSPSGATHVTFTRTTNSSRATRTDPEQAEGPGGCPAPRAFRCAVWHDTGSGGRSSTRGLYSTSWSPPSNVRCSVISSATSGYPS